MSEFKIRYSKARFPMQQKREDGTMGCRGCGGTIPKGRTAWCSKLCCRTYHPGWVIIYTKQRDKGICALCGLDMLALEREWLNKQRTQFPGHRPPKPEFDHIIPFSEGGLTILENMRTLCRPCHTTRTKEWHGKRKVRGQAASSDAQ